MKKIGFTLLAITFLFCVSVVPLCAEDGITINYGDLTLSPGYTDTNFSDVWDLTKCDLALSYTIDMTGITQPAPWATSYTEVGLREVGASNFNPGPLNTYQGGAGGWMTSLVGDLSPDPNNLDLDDKHNLSASEGRGEGDYDVECDDSDTVKTPFGTSVNYGIWFDRDGVDPFQAFLWGAVDGSTYNTGGVYDIVITYHAVTPALGTMCVTVNGIQTGFYTSGWQDAEPDIYPAGLSFKGDMTQMQVFAGLWAPDHTYGDVIVSEVTANGCPSMILIDGCDTGIPDQEYDGMHISELINQCADNAKNHGKFVSCVADLTNDLKKDEIISGKDNGAIVSCAAQADLP